MIDEIRAERLKKLELLREQGMEPYPARSEQSHTLAALAKQFEGLVESGDPVTVVGRVMSRRGQGALSFVDLFDGTGRFQAVLKVDAMDEANYQLFQAAVDQGDFIEVTGVCFTTQRGQPSVLASSWRMLTKSLLPLPDEWYGLKDEDERFRKRYLDMLMNPEVREMVEQKSRFWRVVREFMQEQGFLEVETPVLETTTGGADATPFETHHNALDIDVYLRISAGELWQKKLLAAGLPAVFEIGRIFRNEGMSAEHLQDYTQMEFYQAYADFESGMPMIRELYRRIARDVFGTEQFSIRGHEVDLAGEWERFDYCALIRERFGIDPLETTLEEVRAKLEELGVDTSEVENLERGVDTLWKQMRKEITGPGFLVNIPVYLEPLAKRSAEDPRVVERFQVLIAGSELGKGYSELNDPQDQRARFEEQQQLRDAGDAEAQMADWDFVEALEYGMPPALGFGMSERLFAFLADRPARETQLFPLMRPR
ncbi:lysine--tRNA ligase [Patescibacteria group bacterium]|jgi:lysyl-tRNA synthetase class 2|nr:lysine--tRNA ligase [Patescibacteria group bacterium]